MLKLKDFDYVVFDQDLKKDIEKYCLKQYSGTATIKLNGSIPFKAWVPMKVPNPSAIQDDRALKMKIKKVTDTTYQRHLGDLAHLVKSLGKNEDKRKMDAIWKSIQNANEKIGTKMGKDAQVILGKYLKQKGDAKIASSKFKYNRYKSELSLVGAAAGASVAFAGAANASVATFGASFAAVGMEVAGDAQLIKSAHKEYQRQNKTIEETIYSINKTILALNKSIRKHPGNRNIKVPSEEEGVEMLSEWAGLNMKNIKKLEQDTKLLKTKANLEVSEATKIGALAGEWHTHAKFLARNLKKSQKSLVELENKLPKDSTVSKKIAELEHCMKKLKANTKLVKVEKEHLTSFAQFRRKVAKQLITATIGGPGGLEERAMDFNKARNDIGWTAIPMESLPTLESLNVSSSEAAKPLGHAQKQMEALAGLARSAGETATGLAQFVDGKLKIAKKAAKAVRG